jgi:hypothetical protein
MRRKGVVVASWPYVVCAMNAFFNGNHSATLLAGRIGRCREVRAKRAVSQS